MTDPLRQCQLDLDAALVRARRVAAEVRDTGSAFRRDTDRLAEQVKSGQAQPVQPAQSAQPAQPDDERLREAATRFRRDNGLPVRAVTPSPQRTSGSPRRVTRRGDDDEDFSQKRIMR